MLISMYYLQDSIKRLANIATTIKADQERENSILDFTTVRGNVLQAFMDYKAAIEELDHILLNEDSVITLADGMMGMVESNLRNAGSLEAMNLAINTIITPFKEYDFYRYGLYDCSHDAVFQSDPSLNEEYLKSLANSISMSRPLKVLDTYAGAGRNMQRFKRNYNGQLELYVVDVESEISSENKPEFHRIALGELKGSTISNEVFDVVISAPPQSFQKEGKNYIEKIERDYLYKSINYLRSGGLMVYVIPITHLYREICQHLAKNLTEIEIRLDGRNVYISGYRNMDKDRVVDKDKLIELRTLILNRDNEKYSMSNALPAAHIPAAALPVKMFRGSRLDEEEFHTMFEHSNATAMFLKDQNVEKLSENTKTPLLPFNVGQLGLILTSGCLDGVIDEGNGYSHVVKGRVIKKKESQVEVTEERGQVDMTEITSNRVEINAFLADGTYKCLA